MVPFVEELECSDYEVDEGGLRVLLIVSTQAVVTQVRSLP